ncbi:glycosyltransferase family 2 protein [Paraburkholderia sp. CNPSo 3272]|uniref:glycosyltransferase family 2 protein n=1 Tax=Paraburkholderia sp. CNPSo 3272 TaxID=2940931 RepID=UPI0020B69EAB|nr:glycosyltransferase family 2 protein [Paraburkholderia sp. CNPSo 3272]MCP3723337.1 glycosyltransferase family 2 protein [Paraburkholderia sp. CNPSo 3272]
MNNSLEEALARTSPRLVPPPTPFASIAIHLGVMALWFVLFARAFFLQGVVAWSTGIAYVVYDTVLLLFVAWKARVLLAPAPAGAAAAAAAAKLPTLGVIVAAHNEAAVLPITLDALFAQTRAPQQIVIADDGSSDGTAALLAERYGLADPGVGQLSAPSPRYPNLRWLKLAHGGKARALNAALLAIATETVMTVDADTLLEPDACAAMANAFGREPALVAAAGLLTPVCDHTLSGRFFQWFQTYEYIRNFISRFAWMRADSLLLISGAFAGFRRDAVMAVGGFDADCLVEDYELIHRLRRYSARKGLSWDVRVLGTARARTDAPGTLTTFLRQRRRWFAGFLQTQYWYRDMTGNRKYGKLGLMMLPVKAFDTVQPIYGLTAFALLIGFLFDGRFTIVLPVLGVIVGKIAIDLAFHLYSVHLYRRWSGDRTHASFGMAFLAAIFEPFSFQLMRHAGAALGWLHFLLGRRKWGVQSRTGLAAARNRESAASQ